MVRRQSIGRQSSAHNAYSSLALNPRLPIALAAWPLGTYCASTAEQVVAITYDDGPHPSDTNRILDALGEFGATATFFVMSPLVRSNRAVVRRIVAEGSEVALHGETHRSLLAQTNGDAIASLRRAKAEIEDVAGVAVTLFRPPYGQHSMIHAIAARSLGMRMILWSADAIDWSDDVASAVASRAIEGVYPGSIILMHDNRADPETLRPGESMPTFDRAAVARLVLSHVRAEDFRALTVSTLLSRHPAVKSLDRRLMKR